MEALIYTPCLKPTGNRHSFPHYPTSEMVPLTIQCFYNMTNQHGFSLIFHYKQDCLLCLIPKNRAQEHVNMVTNTYHLHHQFIEHFHLDDSVFLLSMLHTTTCTPCLTFYYELFFQSSTIFRYSRPNLQLSPLSSPIQLSYNCYVSLRHTKLLKFLLID